MMINSNHFCILLSIFFIFDLSSCTHHAVGIRTEEGLGNFDILYAEYPSKRIESAIRKICIVGNKNNSKEDHFLQALFIKLFEAMKLEIDIVESGSAKSLLDSEFIFRNFKLERWKAEKLATLLQIDHIFICEETSSDFNRDSISGHLMHIVDFKIVDTRYGVVSYQDRKQYGIELTSSKTHISEDQFHGIINKLRFKCFYSLVFSLCYAFGDVHHGIIFESDVPNGNPTVSELMFYSPAYNAGITMGDKILKINGIDVSNQLEFKALFGKMRPKQGGSIIFTVKRDDNIFNTKVQFPYISKQDKSYNGKTGKPSRSGPRI